MNFIVLSIPVLQIAPSLQARHRGPELDRDLLPFWKLRKNAGTTSEEQRGKDRKNSKSGSSVAGIQESVAFAALRAGQSFTTQSFRKTSRFYARRAGRSERIFYGNELDDLNAVFLEVSQLIGKHRLKLGTEQNVRSQGR